MSADVVLTDTVVYAEQQGGGIAPGRYIWRGPSSSPVFALQNCRDMVSADVDVVCKYYA